MKHKPISAEQHLAIEMAKAQAKQLYHPVVLIDELENELLYVSSRALRFFARIYNYADGNRMTDCAVRDWTETIHPMCREALNYAREKAKSIDVVDFVAMERKGRAEDGLKTFYLLKITPVCIEPEVVRFWLCTVSITSNKARGRFGVRFRNGQLFMMDGDHTWRPTFLQPLTAAEQRLLKYMGNGYSTGEIAQDFCKSSETIKTHKKNILKKLRSFNMLDAVISAMNVKWL